MSAPQFNAGSAAQDAADAAVLERELGNGTAPPKGSPRRDRLEQAHARHLARRDGKDPTAVEAKNRDKAAKAAMRDADLALARRLRKAFSPVASPAVMAKAAAEKDSALAHNIRSAQAVRTVLRAELARSLSASATKQLDDLVGTDAVESCPVCHGSGEVPPNPCPSCAGLGLAVDLDGDDATTKAIKSARKARKVGRKLAKKAGPDAKVMAKGATKGQAVVIRTDDPAQYRKLKAMSPREFRAAKIGAAKELGVDPSRVGLGGQ